MPIDFTTFQNIAKTDHARVKIDGNNLIGTSKGFLGRAISIVKGTRQEKNKAVYEEFKKALTSKFGDIVGQLSLAEIKPQSKTRLSSAHINRVIEKATAFQQAMLDRRESPDRRMLEELHNARAFGHTQFGGRNGDGSGFGFNNDRIRGAACYNWALSGANNNTLIRPEALFTLLGNDLLDFPFDSILPDNLSEAEQEWYQEHREEIEALREHRRNGTRSVSEVTRQAMVMIIEANGMEVCEPDESPYRIAMESESPDSVDWTHWGVEIDGHTLETNPGYGIWHTRNTFRQNWEGGNREVTTIPVRNLSDSHKEIINAFLNHLGGQQ